MAEIMPQPPKPPRKTAKKRNPYKEYAAKPVKKTPPKKAGNVDKDGNPYISRSKKK
jgi:hypothetical protein